MHDFGQARMRYMPSCGFRILSFLASPLSTKYVLICGVDLKTTFFVVGVVVEEQAVKDVCVVVCVRDFHSSCPIDRNKALCCEL